MERYVLKVFGASANINKDRPMRIYITSDPVAVKRMVHLIGLLVPACKIVWG